MHTSDPSPFRGAGACKVQGMPEADRHYETTPVWTPMWLNRDRTHKAEVGDEWGCFPTDNVQSCSVCRALTSQQRDLIDLQSPWMGRARGNLYIVVCKCVCKWTVEHGLRNALCGASKMPYPVKTLAAKPADPSLISETHTEEGEN